MAKAPAAERIQGERGAEVLHIPASESAERAVLGAVLADANCFYRVVDTVGPEDFYTDTHRAIFEAFMRLAADNRDIDLLTTTDQLERSGTVDAAGGAAYVAGLAEGLPDPANVQHYATILRDLSRRRELQRLGRELLHTAARRDVDAGELASRIAGTLRRLESGGEAASIAHLTTEQLLELAIPPRDYIAAPVFRQKDSIMVAGGRGVGKTWVLLEIALCLASGETILDRWRPPRRHRVLHVDGEMAGRAMQERVSARILAAGFDPGEYLRFLLADLTPHGLPNIADTSGQAFFDRMIEETRAEVLVLDNLSCLTQGLDENDALAWEPVQTWLVSLRRRGVATFFGHHLGKGGSQRGTSRREDTLDASILLTAPEDDDRADGCRFVVKFSKARGISGRAVAPFEARLVPGLAGGVAWAVQDMRDETDELIREMAAAGRPVRAIAAELGIPRSTVHRRLHRLRTAGGGS